MDEETPSKLSSGVKRDVAAIPSTQRARASRRFEITKEVLDAGPPYRDAVLKTASKHKVSAATLYAWLQRVLSSGDPLSLCDRPKNRSFSLKLRVLEIIEDVFDEWLGTKEDFTKTDLYIKIQGLCWEAGEKAPSFTSVLFHLKRLVTERGEKYVLEKRGKRQLARAKHGVFRGTFDRPDRPWSIIEMDHTLLDIMVVDEEQRLSIGRPYITVAMDVFSRMIVGYYISLDPVGTTATAICLQHAVFPKAKWLEEHRVEAPWPAMGTPAVLHFDNAKEFWGETVRFGCERYNMQIWHRMVGHPYLGGHIEKVIKTLNGTLRKLRGKTGSSVADNKEYDSEKYASLSLFDLNRHVTQWIAGTYHTRRHRTTNRTPNALYSAGIRGDENSLGVGRRAFPVDEAQFRIDFTPIQRKTIQRYGVTIDGLIYGGDVLDRYTRATDANGESKRFLFRRDPRYINEIFFYDEQDDKHVAIGLTQPLEKRMDLWAWRALRRRQRLLGESEVDHRAIWESTKALEEIHKEAYQQTKSATKQKAIRRARERSRQHAKAVPASPESKRLQKSDLENVIPLPRLRAC